MAEEPTLTDAIDQSLRYDHAMLDELVEITSEWRNIPEPERTSWLLDWDQFALDKIRMITEDYSRGVMTPEQEAEYRRLITRIEQHRHLIQRFGLTMPRTLVES